jgi:hypothetical protein
MAKPRTALLQSLSVALPVLLCQCASPGPTLQRVVTLESGQLVRISLVQVQGGQTLTLQNASYSKPADVYSDPAGDRTVKVIDDEEVQKLLDVLAGQGMFERAAPLPAGDARELIAVQQGDRRWIWSRRAASTVDVEAFGNARVCVMAVYNSTTAYHKAQLSGRDLDAEKDRIEKASAEARQKAEQKGPPK